MPPPQALALARSKGLDLVEISPTAMPPVCRIMDFGKYQYEQQKRARSAKKHQKVILVKEIKFRPKVRPICPGRSPGNTATTKASPEGGAIPDSRKAIILS